MEKYVHMWEKGFEDSSGQTKPRACIECLLLYLNTHDQTPRQLKESITLHMKEIRRKREKYVGLE